MDQSNQNTASAIARRLYLRPGALSAVILFCPGAVVMGSVRPGAILPNAGNSRGAQDLLPAIVLGVVVLIVQLVLWWVLTGA